MANADDVSTDGASSEYGEIGEKEKSNVPVAPQSPVEFEGKRRHRLPDGSLSGWATVRPWK